MDCDEDDEGDEWDDEESVVVACPSCGAEVYEEAEQCPACGEWITPSSHPFPGRSWWFIGLGLAGMAATIIVLVLLGF
jgi:hypothetical protein